MNRHAWWWLFALMAALAVPSARAESAEDQLWDAIARSNVAEVRATLADGADVRSSRRPFLAAALARRNVEVVELLLAAGADVNRPSMEGGKPLALAVAFPDLPLAVLDQLVAAGAKVTAEGQPDALLVAAVRGKNDAAVGWLLERKAPVDATDASGATALMVLAQRRTHDPSPVLAVARQLLAAGADRDHRDRQGKTAGDYAAVSGAVELLEQLEPGNPQNRDLKSLRQAGLDLRLGLALIEHARSRVRWSSPHPRPASQLDAITALLKQGANPMATVTIFGPPRSLLEMALPSADDPSGEADPAVLKLLLEAGARWDGLGERRGSCLAGLLRDPELLRVALAHALPVGAEAELQEFSRDGRTTRVKMPLLHAAAVLGADKSVALLLDKGAAIEAKDAQGYTALMRAVSAGTLTCTQVLLDRHARHDGPAPDGRSWAALAIAAGDVTRAKQWDKAGEFAEFLADYPAAPRSRYLGEWISGDEKWQQQLTLKPDGGGEWMRRPVAWRETEDGILVRISQRRSRYPLGHAAFVELQFVGDGEGRLRASGQGAGAFVDELRRAGVPRPDPNHVSEANSEKEREAAIANQIAAIRSGRSDAFQLSAGVARWPRELLAESARVHALSIGSRGLLVLPAELARLSELSRLEIVNQGSLRIEPGALALPKLTRLEFRACQLRELPLVPDALPMLAEFSVHDNRLRTLPGGWRGAQALTGFGVSGNRLAALPEDLGDAPRLRVVSASDNQLVDLPASLARAPIDNLYLPNNRFASLPAVIRQLPRLSSLSIDGNRLTELPAWLNELRELKSLDVAGNQLSVLPNLRELPKLEYLSLRGNLIAELPDDPACLPPSVTQLDLSGNRLSAVPAWFKERAFSRLNLRGNPLPEAEARALEDAARRKWDEQRSRKRP
jgi:ankyrin repeat protein